MVRLADSSAFARSGTSVAAEGVTTVDGDLIIDGTESVNGPLAVHGTATFDGDTTIGGNAAITGTLSLPAGIIDNAALASPVSAQVLYIDADNLTVNTPPYGAAKVNTTVTVPAGFTRAVVSVVARLSVYNQHTTGGSNGTGGDFVYCQVSIGAIYGNSIGTVVLGSGDVAYDVTPLSTVITGLTGGDTFVVAVYGEVDFVNMAASVWNEATASGTIIWLR